jgi:hypothetical protein
MRNRTVRMAGLALATGLACAPGHGWAQRVTPGEEHGLGLLGADTPQFLKDIEADPYRAPSAPACASIPQELAQIDGVLGPDVDTHATTKTTAGEFVGGAVRGILPYGGVVRVMTGAGRRDRALIKAAMAGYARRGYLRGLEQNLACAAPAPTDGKAADAAAVVPSANLPAAPASTPNPDPRR